MLSCGSGYGGIRRRAWGKVHMLRSGKRGDLAPLEDQPPPSGAFLAPGTFSNSQYSALDESGMALASFFILVKLVVSLSKRYICFDCNFYDLHTAFYFLTKNKMKPSKP
jgi:hypothetical protein